MIEIIPNFHPAFVHFPIAFITAVVFLVAIGLLFKQQPWAKQCLIFGRWMLWAAAIFAIIAAVFGWFAFNSVKHDDHSHLAMLEHRAWALWTLALLVMLAGWDVWRNKVDAPPKWWFVCAIIAAWAMVFSTAWHGGELVYRHGLGVMALPKIESHGHAETVNGGHPHDAVPAHDMPAMDGTGTVPDKAGHAHAPGAPPHKD